MTNFIQLNQASRWFETEAGRVDAIKNINLDINQGEHLAIVNKSGSGKSTLLTMLTGIDHPSQGYVTIQSTDAHSPGDDRPAKWRGRNVGIVFQFFQMIPPLTIRENLLLAMDFVGSIPKKDRSNPAGALLARVGIVAHADKLQASLSVGSNSAPRSRAPCSSENPLKLISPENRQAMYG